MLMTWKEFKEIVNKEVKDDEEIKYIDVSYPVKKLYIEHTELGVTIE